MKEYLPEPPSNWNLFAIQAISSAPPSTPPPGTMGAVGTYAKESSSQYGGSYGLKEITARIVFGYIDRVDLMETSNFIIAGKNVTAGYTYMYEAQLLREMKPGETPPEPVKKRDKYTIIFADYERLAMMSSETSAGLQSEHENMMKQFMTDIINAVYK